LDFLLEVTLFLLAAVVAVPIFQWLGFGAVLGYLVGVIGVMPAALSGGPGTRRLAGYPYDYISGNNGVTWQRLLMRHNIFFSGWAWQGLSKYRVRRCRFGLVALWSFGLGLAGVTDCGLGFCLFLNGLCHAGIDGRT